MKKPIDWRTTWARLKSGEAAPPDPHEFCSADESDLMHWAQFGLVSSPSSGFEPSSGHAAHDAPPPRYPPGADPLRIFTVEDRVHLACSLARADATEAGRRGARAASHASRYRARHLRDEDAGRAFRAAAASPQRTACRIRAILALEYGAARVSGVGELSALQATLSLPAYRKLLRRAQVYYAEAVDLIPARKAKPKPAADRIAAPYPGLQANLKAIRRLIVRYGVPS